MSIAATLMSFVVASCSDKEVVAPRAALRLLPIRLDIVAGQNQTGKPGTQLPNALVVRVVDASGGPVQGQLVNFRVTTGGGSVFAGAALTNSNGQAQEWWTLGPAPGSNTLEVRAVDSETGEKLTFATFHAEGREPVASVRVLPQAVSLRVGGSVELSVVVTDSAGNLLQERPVTWTSTNAAVATVAASGSTGAVAMAHSPGTAEIIVSAEGTSDTTVVTVEELVASVTVMPKLATMQVGDSVALTAIPRDSAGNALTDRTVTWSSADENVATVSPRGGTGAVATALSPGVTEIVATAEGKSDTARITVEKPVAVASVTVMPQLATVPVGDSVAMTATPRDSAGNPLMNRTVRWSSTDPQVARVSPRGATGAIVTAVSPGVTTIVAASEGKSDTATVSVVPRPGGPGGIGIWIGSAEISELPTTGLAWDNLKSAADRSCGMPDLANQEDPTNTCIMAQALVFARTGEASYRDSVVGAIRAIVSAPPYIGRALALGRELVGYVISADLIGLSAHDPALDDRFRSKLLELRTTPTVNGPNNLLECDSIRPNNWGTHCGATVTAIAAYLQDRAELERVARIFKGWVGDRSSYAAFVYGEKSWQCDPDNPVGINPAGCTRYGLNLDGVLPDDQRRCGTFIWPNCRTQYFWEALQGATVQAMLLTRQNYPAFLWENKALLRALVWVHEQNNFPADGDDTWIPHLINNVYGSSFPAPVPTRPGKNVGWTDWTHGST